MRNSGSISWLITLVGFPVLFFIYIFDLEKMFMLTTPIARININLLFPVMFLFVITVYTCGYSRLSGRRFLDSFILILPLAVFWQLAFFLIELIGSDPWKGTKLIFAAYSRIYISAGLAACLVMAGKLKSYFDDDQKPLLYIPGVAFIVYLLYRIIATNSYAFAYSIPLAVLGIFLLLKLWRIFKSMSKTRQQVVIIALLFILAFGVRLAWGERLISIAQDKFYAASDDGVTYGLYAEDWARGIHRSPLETYGGWGYWVFLGAIYRIFGNPNYHAAIFIQAILGALVPIFIFLLAKRITGIPVAALSGFLVSLDMNNVFCGTIVAMEALFIPLVFLILYLLIKFINNGRIKRLAYPFLIGILLGIATIVRTEPVLFLVVIAICFFIFSQGRFSRLDSFKINIALFLGLALILAAFSLRNYIKEGKFDFKSESAAIAFSLTTAPGMEETKMLADMGFNPFAEGGLGTSLRVFINQPLRVSSLFLSGIYKKSIEYLFVPNFGEMDFLTLLNPSGVGPGYRFPLYAKFYIHLLILIGLAKFALKKEFRLERSILLGYIGYTIFIYASIMTRNARYRAVLEPLFIILFACGVHWIFKRFKMVLVQGKN